MTKAIHIQHLKPYVDEKSTPQAISGSQRENVPLSTTKIILSKAFFGKSNCLKVTLNDKKETYFHFGVEQKNEWTWKKVKFSDVELGEMILVLEGKKEKIAFYHKFNNDNTQIWISKKDNGLILKVKEVSKGLIENEAKVLELLLKHIIVRSCIEF